MAPANNKELYRKLCDEQGSAIPLFQQYWWMEAVCADKEWDVLFATTSDGSITAALPYLIGRKAGMRYVVQPQLTQFCGIWYNRQMMPTDARHREQFEVAAAEKIIAQIKQLHLVYFQQNLAPEITNWLPFHWAGFHQTTRYTYRINDIDDSTEVFARFSKNERQRRIEKVLHHCQTVELSPTRFTDFQDRCRQATGQKNLLSRRLVERVCGAAKERGQSLCIGLSDEKDTLMAALFVPYDDKCAYYLIPALAPEHRNNGAMETLVWIALQRLAGITRCFDFEGSMDRGIGQYYRSFGAQQVPYHSLSKSIFTCLVR